jgi:hypothetical protein
MNITLVDILNDLLPVADSRRRQWVDIPSKILDSSRTHLVLMSNRMDRKLARLLLNHSEWRLAGLFGVRFAVDAVSGNEFSDLDCHIPREKESPYPIDHGGMPSSWN